MSESIQANTICVNGNAIVFLGDGTPNYLEPNYPEVEVFNVVTPNDDGVHDYLIISGLDLRPNGLPLARKKNYLRAPISTC